MSAPGLRHGFEESPVKSVSKSVERIGFPVAGWTGLPLGSIVDVCRAGYSVPGLSSGGCDSAFGTGVASAFKVGMGVTDAFRVSVDGAVVSVGRFGCLPSVSNSRLGCDHARTILLQP